MHQLFFSEHFNFYNVSFSSFFYLINVLLLIIIVWDNRSISLFKEYMEREHIGWRRYNFWNGRIIIVRINSLHYSYYYVIRVGLGWQSLDTLMLPWSPPFLSVQLFKGPFSEMKDLLKFDSLGNGNLVFCASAQPELNSDTWCVLLFLSHVYRICLYLWLRNVPCPVLIKVFASFLLSLRSYAVHSFIVSGGNYDYVTQSWR